jgi:hypothetical protein
MYYFIIMIYKLKNNYKNNIYNNNKTDCLYKNK